MAATHYYVAANQTGATALHRGKRPVQAQWRTMCLCVCCVCLDVLRQRNESSSEWLDQEMNECERGKLTPEQEA
jgi:hypothetical protein